MQRFVLVRHEIFCITGRIERWGKFMKDAKNELMQFVAGVVMLAVGLYIFSQKVIVFSGYGFFFLGGGRFSSGLIIIPLIIGIVWMFMTDSFASKVFSALAGLLIVIAVILSTNIHLTSMTLFDWLLILVLIFGGLGFVGRVLLADRKNDEVDPREEMYREMYGESTDKKLKRRK